MAQAIKGRRGPKVQPLQTLLKTENAGSRVLAVLALITVVLALYGLWARPYQLHWGASDAEVQRPMPGDELDPKPEVLATRAITIVGTPPEIWPWLIQMGYRRAGLYGFDLFKDVASSRVANAADRIQPQFQDLKVGDPVPISPFENMVAHAIRPYEYLVWSGETGSGGLTWALYPVDSTHTRLVSRIRRSYRWTQPALLGLDLLTEFTDHLTVRKILQGVKGRVEGDIQPLADANIELFLYFGSLLVFVWATSSVLRLPLTPSSWLVGLAGGLAWLTTWYAPISIWIGATLCLLVVWAVRVEFRDQLRSRTVRPESAALGRGRKRR